MAIGDLPANYKIRLEKDYASVKTTYDLGISVGGPARDGTNLISGFIQSVMVCWLSAALPGRTSRQVPTQHDGDSWRATRTDTQPLT